MSTTWPVAGFAGFATGEMGQGPAAADMIAIPNFNTTTVLPWRKNIGLWVAVILREWCPVAVLRAEPANGQ